MPDAQRQLPVGTARVLYPEASRVRDPGFCVTPSG